LVALFLTLPLKNGWQWVKTARNLNISVSRNGFCDFLADPDSRSFSRFGAIIMQFAVSRRVLVLACRYLEEQAWLLVGLEKVQPFLLACLVGT
jgi:hypothetical protein